MLTIEDIQNEVNRLFGEDADMVSITYLSRGFGFNVGVGADGCEITDWSEMDLISDLYEYFLRDFGG